MARYAFKCSKCDATTESEHTIADRPDQIECTECGAVAHIKIGGAGLIAGKSALPDSKRKQLHKNLEQREVRLTEMELATPDGKERVAQFRKLSKKITNGKF